MSALDFCTLRAAFPLSPLAHLHDDDTFDPDTPLRSVSDIQISEVIERVARWLGDNPSVCLGPALPGLWLARDLPIATADLPVRVVTGLSRVSVGAWGDVLELSPAMLADVQGFGEGCLHSFLVAAVRAALAACRLRPPPRPCPTVGIFETKQFPARAGRAMTLMGRLAEWACERGAATVADLFGAFASTHQPEDIAELVACLRAMPLAELWPEVTVPQPVEQSVVDLCAVLDVRSRHIFLARISLDRPRTLEDLATVYGVTKERVRQVCVRAEERVRSALTAPRFAPVGWRAHALALRLGFGVPGDTAEHAEALLDATRGVTETNRDLVTDFLCWLAGPYTRQAGTGWFAAGELPGTELIDDRVDANGRIDAGRVGELLSAAGLLPATHHRWLVQIGRAKMVGSHWLLWTGAVADKVVRLLALWGEPATVEALVEAVGENHEVRGTRNRLMEDPRLMRVDQSRFALRTWGLEEYTGIADEIAEEIDRCGGTARLNELVTTLVERFGLKEASVRYYATAPMFVIAGGEIRRRTQNDPLPTVRPVTETAACYLLAPDTLSWRVEVNAETLRGSGRPMPAPVANWLGVSPGGQRVFSAGGVAVRVTWPMAAPAGPSLGSIRPLAEREGAAAGEQLLLRFDRAGGTVEAVRIDPALAATTDGLEKIALLTGIPPGDESVTTVRQLAQALGCRETRVSVFDSLTNRGERVLANLLPPEAEAPELDAALDGLRDLL